MIKRRLCVKLRTYTDRDGREKAVWQEIGHVHEGRNGGEFITLHRWVNLAGLPVREGDDRVMVSVFDVDEEREGRANAPTPRAAPSRPARSTPSSPAPDFDDDIPF